MTEKRERWQGKGVVRKTKVQMATARVMVVRVLTIRGTSLSQQESGEKSPQKWTQWGTTVKRTVQYVEQKL